MIKRNIQLLLLVALAVGILFSLNAVKEQQNLKGKATLNPDDAFQFTNPAGQPLPRNGTIITTDSPTIEINLSDPNAIP